LVKQAEQDAKSTIIKAQGEAKSAEMIGKAMAKNPGYIQLRQLDAALQISATVGKSANKLYLDSESLLLNVQKVRVRACVCVHVWMSARPFEHFTRHSRWRCEGRSCESHRGVAY
jgi:hypothetical protein